MNQLILIGGGGHCKSCIEVIESTNQFEIIGILDILPKVGERILDYKIIGTDNDIRHFIQQGITHFFITLGQIKTQEIRKKTFDLLMVNKVQIPIIISSKAIVSSRTTIGKGTIIMHSAIVNADVKVGDNCIINTMANIEHEVIIGNNVHISTGAMINGQVVLGNDIFVGSNSVIKNNIAICDNVVIGAGSVVLKDIKTPGTYVGNPVRKIN